MNVASMLNTLQFKPELCINCEMCITVCPHSVFAPGDHKVQLIKPEACMECGACQINCSVQAITVDSGVGCASALMYAALTGKNEVFCGNEPKSSS